ncbi:MAG TPA: glycosyltransferase family 4 protein [Polyangiaceae bacterium]|nr:glycosyltransferase family 4 protein [Polyangiaceae bacterium]
MNNHPRIGFFTERQVGIGSAAAAIEPHLRNRPNTTWTNVTYQEPGGFVERLKLPGRLGGTLRGFLQTGGALRRGPFDALFFLTHNPAVFRQQEMGRTPTALWTDVTPALLDAQADQYAHPVDDRSSVRALKKALVQRTFRRAALCLGWSEWARRSFVADYGVPEEKTGVVPPGIDLARWTMTERSLAGALPRVLFVGGDFARKGGDLLLEVFRAHFRGRCALDIVTRDPIAEEDGVSIHHGLNATSPRLLDLYRAASAFVLPTRGDCFSIASMEAMAVGLPVVVSKVGGISEIVLEGETGHLIGPGNGPDLKSAIESLLGDAERRRQMGVAGRRRVEDRFDAQKTADRLFALLTTIASEGRRR